MGLHLCQYMLLICILWVAERCQHCLQLLCSYSGDPDAIHKSLQTCPSLCYLEGKGNSGPARLVSSKASNSNGRELKLLALLYHSAARGLAGSGELTAPITLPFEFPNVEMQYDSYKGQQVCVCVLVFLPFVFPT